MDDPLAQWHLEHVRFAQLLDMLQSQLALFHEASDPDYDLMSTIVRYLTGFADVAHHPREDLAFARLAQREPQLKPVIDRLRQEHRVIANAGAALLSALDEAAKDVLIPRATLEAAAATYLVYYRNHLDTEEHDILPQAARRLSAADWQAVAPAPAVNDAALADLLTQIVRATPAPLR